MNIIWYNRIFIVLYIPFITFFSESFFSGLMYMISFFLLEILTVIFILLISLLFMKRTKLIFYSYFFGFMVISYSLFSIFYSGPEDILPLVFLKYFFMLTPTLFLVDSFTQNGKSVFEYKDLLSISAFIGLLLPILGLLRECLSFQDIYLFSFDGYIVEIPLFQWTQQIHLHLSNNFFITPLGGLFLLGIVLSLILKRLQVKYDI